MSTIGVNLRHVSFGKRMIKFVSTATSVSLIGYSYYQYRQNGPAPPGKKLVASNLVALSLFKAKESTKKFNEYQEVYNDIANKVREEDDYDDGSYGPILVRLAWHQSGTYRKTPNGELGCPFAQNSGGSYGGTMHFKYEADEPGNAGLHVAREFLEEFKLKYPWLSYGDLYTLGGVVGIQELGGPKIEWRSGRADLDEKNQLPHGRLPDGLQGAAHIRDVFGPSAMGFDDEEIVTLIGAHCLGRCHTNFSGFDGPWTFSPTFFTNEFYKLLLDEKWHIRDWDGPRQWQDDKSKSLMMLPLDYALIEDDKFKKFVVKYALDQDLFFNKFSKSFAKLLELGIEFPSSIKPFVFKTLDEQE